MESFCNITTNTNTDCWHDKVAFITHVVTCVIICIGLPLTLVAIYGFYSLVRKDHVAPIYIINLLIADLIQFCIMIVKVATKSEVGIIRKSSSLIHTFALMASICFMVCVSMERYLVVAWPVWYRFRRNIKTSVVVCVAVWIVSLTLLFPLYFWVDSEITTIIFGVLLLLPLPLFIFSLVGTCKVLSTSRVPSDEKRRIVAILVVVLLIYFLLFLPIIISFLKQSGKHSLFRDVALNFVNFSPLTDVFLYIFIRKGAVDTLLSSACCCSMDSNDMNSDINNDISRTTV